MSESIILTEMKQRINDLIASGKHNGQVVAALEDFGYEVFDHPLFGKGVSSISNGERVACFHPILDENKTADP